MLCFIFLTGSFHGGFPGGCVGDMLLDKSPASGIFVSPYINLRYDFVVQLLSCVSLWPHGLQHARLPCPSPIPGIHSNSCPLSRWCHPAISSSVIPFSSCLQSFPASGSFLMIWLFISGGQSIGASASASVFPMNIQDWFPLGWTDGSPCSPRDSQESSPTPQFQSISSSVLRLLYGPTVTNDMIKTSVIYLLT